jgi:hypothetical protein
MSDMQLTDETELIAAELMGIARAGVKKALQESRRLGVPNVYSIDGVLHWELPNGELTTEDPYLKLQASDQAKGTTEDAKGPEEK